MNDPIVLSCHVIFLTCVVSVVTVAISAMFLGAWSARKGSDRSEKHDRVMALLLTKAINAAVVPEIDQVARIRAEAGEDPPATREDVGPPMLGGTNSEYETAGAPRGDPLD